MRRHVPLLGALMMAHGALIFVLAMLLFCSVPAGLMDGGDIGAAVLGVLWGMTCAFVAVGLAVAGARVRQHKGRLLALVMLVLQAPLTFCFCALPSLALLVFGGVMLLIDADAIDSFT